MDSSPCTVTLWHASGVEVPRELLSALAGVKGPSATPVRIHMVGDPFFALANLCKTTLEERKASKASTSARLVIVYPEMMTDASELCVAMDTYTPGVPRWQYGPVTNPTLRPIVDADIEAWATRGVKPEIVVVPQAQEASKASRTIGPQLRLAGEGPRGLDNQQETADAGNEGTFSGPGASQPSSSGARAKPLITDEELRMLLGESND